MYLIIKVKFKFGFMGETILSEDAPNESLHLSVTKEL